MRRTKEEAEQTRRDILVSAETLFLERGVAHTSLEEIARHAGVTRGAVYWHFQNKAHLFHAMLDQVRLPPEQLARRVCDCTPEHPAQALLVLHGICTQALADLAQSEQKQRILTILLYRCEFTDELREAQVRHEQFVEQFIKLCENLFEHAHAAGQLHPTITPRMAARTLHALIIGLFGEWLRDRTTFDPLKDAPRMIDSLFRGLTVCWPPAPAQASSTS